MSGSRSVVVVDARMLAYPLTGIGRYTLELLKALTAATDADWALLSHAPVPDHLRGQLPATVTWCQGTGVGRAEAWMQRAAARMLRETDASFFLGLANSVPFFGPTSVKYALVVYDLTFFAVPRLTHWQDLIKGYLVNLPSILRSHIVLAISGAVQRELRKWVPSIGARCTALPVGGTKFIMLAGARPFQRRAGFLAVGAHPRKNTGLLLNAYASLPLEARRAHPLHLLAHNLTDEIAEQVNRLGLKDHVLLHPDASDIELGRLYAECLALVYPSVYEGLGLPVAEAMLAGLPVLVAARSPMAEILGGGGIALDRLEVGALTAAMQVLSVDRRRWEECSAAALRASATISWARVGEAVREILGLPARA